MQRLIIYTQYAIIEDSQQFTTMALFQAFCKG